MSGVVVCLHREEAAVPVGPTRSSAEPFPFVARQKREERPARFRLRVALELHPRGHRPLLRQDVSGEGIHKTCAFRGANPHGLAAAPSRRELQTLGAKRRDGRAVGRRSVGRPVERRTEERPLRRVVPLHGDARVPRRAEPDGEEVDRPRPLVLDGERKIQVRRFRREDAQRREVAPEGARRLHLNRAETVVLRSGAVRRDPAVQLAAADRAPLRQHVCDKRHVSVLVSREVRAFHSIDDDPACPVREGLRGVDAETIRQHLHADVLDVPPVREHHRDVVPDGVLEMAQGISDFVLDALPRPGGRENHGGVCRGGEGRYGGDCRHGQRERDAPPKTCGAFALAGGKIAVHGRFP